MTRSPSSQAFRWGLIGPGGIAGQFTDALHVIDGSCLHAVAGRNKTRADKFASAHRATACYDNHHALLDDPLVDAVYIATPHRYHHALARDCLLAGKPVLCEKPLTVNARQAQQLIELSRQNGVFLMEALWTRFLPIYEQVSRWLVAGRIGTVTSTCSSFGFVASRHPQNRQLDHTQAGGALLDIGIYNLSMSQWVFGMEPQHHTIKGQLGDTRVDEHDAVTLCYPGGRRSTFNCSFTTALANDFTIHGSSGKIRVHEMFWAATRATLVPGETTGPEQRPETITRGFRATGLEYEIEAVQNCIRHGMIECPDMSHGDTLATLKLMDAMRHDIGLVYDFE